MSKSLVTECEDGKRKKIKKKEMVGFIFRYSNITCGWYKCTSYAYIARTPNQMSLTIQQKRSGKEDEVKSKWATNQIWKIHATGNTAFDVW